MSAIAATGPLQADREHAARDAIALLRSGADPTAQLPDTWDIYSHTLPDAFTAACLVLAVLTLETVREVAAADQADPGDLWRDWVASNEGA